MSVTMPMNSDKKYKFYEACGFQLGAGTAAGAIITFGAGPGSGAFTELKNCVMKFTNVGQQITSVGTFIWRDTPAAIDTGTVPTSLFTTGDPLQVFLTGVDLFDKPS